MEIEFTKMHGAGNDYIYVNTLHYPIEHPEQLAVKWSAYHTGIGSDGLVLICPSDKGDFKMRIFNADGSEALMCGNASRCVGKYVYEEGLTDKKDILLETLSGMKVLHLHVNDRNIVETVTVDMGIPADIHLVSLGEGYPVEEGIAVSMGNPHLVIFVDDINRVKLEKIGPVLECHPLFPDRVNVEFVQVFSDDAVRMRVWERGSGVTQACGTGACASVVAAVFAGRCESKQSVVMDGGTLEIEWAADGHIYMTGPAVKVFCGKIII